MPESPHPFQILTPSFIMDAVESQGFRCDCRTLARADRYVDRRRQGGARDEYLWPGLQWWLDAVQRPLGAYYRVDTRSVTDMHVALNEIGILYASAVCHSGWDDGFSNRLRKVDSPCFLDQPFQGRRKLACLDQTA